MNTKVIKNLGSVLLVLTLIVSLFPIGAFAESPVTKVEITKKILKAEDVFAPATTFTFAIKPGNPVTENNKPIKAGVVNAVTFAKNTITSAPKTDDIGKTEVVIDEKASLKVDASKFSEPGIYRYVVTEEASAYKGIKPNNEEKYFDVYVKRGAAGLEAYSFTFVKTGNTKEKDDGIFTNDYKNEDNNGNNWLTKLTVTKKVTGLLGDTQKDFNFKVTVNGQVGEKFNLVKSNGDKIELNTNVTSDIKLKHDENFYITGLSADDKVTVKEDSYVNEGYTTTYSGVNENITTTKEAMALTVTNDNDSTTPTGLLMTYGPYALLVGVGAAILFVYGRKRRSYED